MKKLILILLAPILLLGCRKAEILSTDLPSADTTRHALKFTVDDLVTTTKTMNSTGGKVTSAVGDTLRNYANFLYYSIFNSQGLWIKDIAQTSDLTSFGTIYDLQPAGKYTVYIAASKTRLPPTINTKSAADSYFRTGNDTGWPDFFAKAVSVSVGSTDVTQSVRLDRVLAGYRVVLEDAIPDGVAKLTVQVTNDNQYYYFTGRSSTPYASSTKEFPLTSADKGVKNKTFEGTVGNVTNYTNLLIKGYNGSGEIIAQKTVAYIKFEAGKRSVITGNLFTPVTNPSAGFTVTVDPNWTTAPTVKL
jgi:hypothetical protein